MFKIWLVDSSLQFSSAFSKFLMNYGFNVLINTDLNKKYENEEINLIIIDFNLYSEKFYQLVKNIRNQNNYLKIILLSDSYSYEIIQVLLELRIDAFLIEKNNFYPILDTITDLLYTNRINKKIIEFSKEYTNSFIKEKILTNINFLANYIKELNLNYYSIFKLKNFLQKDSYIRILEVLEDFIEVLINLSKAQIVIIIKQIDEILGSIILLQESDTSLITRIENLLFFYEIYFNFVELKIYEALPKSLNLYEYYCKTRNGPMIIKTIGILVPCYCFTGLFDKSSQLFNDFLNLNFLNKHVHLLHRKYIYLILKNYNLIKVLKNDSAYYNNGIFTNVSLNDFLFQNKFFLDQAYLNTKLIYTTFFGSLDDINELTTNLYSNLINNPINYNNNNYILVIDSLIKYFLLKGENSKGKLLLDSTLKFFDYYNKEFDLYPLKTYEIHFLIINEEIDIVYLIFQDYMEVISNHFRNSMIYKDLFIEYMNYLLLTGNYFKFSSLFKNLLSDFVHFEVKGPYFFLLFEPMLHYTITRNEFIFNLIVPELTLNLNSNKNSFSYLSSELLNLMLKINEAGLNKSTLDKLLSLFYQSIESNQLYLSKCIIVLNLELMINLFLEKNELGVYFIQIANEYEHYVDYFKELKLYQNYIKCLINIIKNFSIQDQRINSNIQFYYYYFNKKKIKFFAENIEKYISKITKPFIFTSINQLNEGQKFDISYFYYPLTKLYKIANNLNFGILEVSIIIVLNKFKNMTRSQIAMELSQNQSSIRYTLKKLIDDKFID